ncbi:MAG: NAD+ synthase [Treponemataceae bacterium]|nr:NAD+ synthase [Treponemataceae bacterium]
MRIALAQIDTTIADFGGTCEKVIHFTKEAKTKGAQMILFPELALGGYPPMDLLDQESFADFSEKALRRLQQEVPPDIAVAIGYVARNRHTQGKALVNAYGVILNGALVFEQEKTLLPTYDVFDEARYFESARKRAVFSYQGLRIGFAICEDMWRESDNPSIHYEIDPIRELLDQGAQILCVPSASPYYAYKMEQRVTLTEKICRRGNVPLIYLNLVGANDSIIFDGRSFVAEPHPNGKVSLSLVGPAFEEALLYWDWEVEKKGHLSPGSTALTDGPLSPPREMLSTAQSSQGFSESSHHKELKQREDSELDLIEKALVTGIRGYMKKCGFSRAHLGLSGGIDSALVAYLAVQAIGKENVVAFGLPSRFSSRGSRDDAQELAKNLGIRFEMLSIEPAFTAYLQTLEPVFEGRPFDLAEENLQARIRGTLLMAYSNKFNSMLLTTGNKSELAMGYCTLYGDMAGALAPIGDLLKIEVYALCRRINARCEQGGHKPVFPEAILTKAPSAELRPNQVDQDSLPPYEILDEILKLYVLENLSKVEIVQRGWDEALVSRVITAVARAEYKRRQAPPVLKVSRRAFGMGRRMPIARVIYEG